MGLRYSGVGEKAKMLGKGEIDRDDVESGCGEEFFAVGFVEDVVMEATVIEVIQRSLFERLERAGCEIARQVVFFKDFGEMGQIVFADITLEVLEHVGDRGGSTVVVEGIPVEGKDQNEGASRPEHTLPLVKSFDWIGKVLEVVRGEDEIVARGCDGGELGTVADEGVARGLVGAEDELSFVSCPDRIAGEVAVV